MNKLTQTLKENLQIILEQYGELELIVAFSGGVDSQVLLHALMQLKDSQNIQNKITVCHVNHGLSDNADLWQEFAVQTCKNLCVPLVVKRVEVVAQAQKSLEALARDARYDAITSLRTNKAVVLTGHHSDDQTETFLLALKRGGGLKGLSAMSKTTTLAQHILARPLLTLSRQEIDQYAQDYQLNWIEDESNTDTRFDRNFIRQKIIPLLRARWPSINATINRSASHCASGQELLDELAAQDLINSASINKTTIQLQQSGLVISELIALSAARFNNLIRYYMAQHDCQMASTEQIKQVRLQLTANEDKTPAIKVGESFFRRYKGCLYLTPDYKNLNDWQTTLSLVNPDIAVTEQKVTLPDGIGELVCKLWSSKGLPSNSCADSEQLPPITLPSSTQKVTLRFSHNNPTCEPHFRQHSRALKKVLQELSIAPWQRKRIAFLYYDDELVAAIGHFVCKPFIAVPNEKTKAVTLSLL